MVTRTEYLSVSEYANVFVLDERLFFQVEKRNYIWKKYDGE